MKKNKQKPNQTLKNTSIDDHYLSITLMVSLALYSLFSIGNMKGKMTLVRASIYRENLRVSTRLIYYF